MGRICPKVCIWEVEYDCTDLFFWPLKFSLSFVFLFSVNCVTLQCSKWQVCCCLKGQGPIWASECPGSLMWQCTCLAFQSLHPKPRTRPRHQRARPALTHMQQQPGHLWSFGSLHVCVHVCMSAYVCVCLHPDSVWDLIFQPTLTLCLACEPLGATLCVLQATAMSEAEACGCILGVCRGITSTGSCK